MFYVQKSSPTIIMILTKSLEDLTLIIKIFQAVKRKPLHVLPD